MQKKRWFADWIFLIAPAVGLILLAVGVFVASRATRPGAIVISGVYVRATAAGNATQNADATPDADSMANMPGMEDIGVDSAAYMVIQNNTALPQEIVSITSDASEAAEIHRTVVTNGIAQMEPLDDLTLQPNATLELKPGGNHLMLEGLKRNLYVGDSVKITISFKSGDQITVVAPVTGP